MNGSMRILLLEKRTVSVSQAESWNRNLPFSRLRSRSRLLFDRECESFSRSVLRRIIRKANSPACNAQRGMLFRYYFRLVQTCVKISR